MVSSVAVQNGYNSYNGILEKLTQQGTGKILWQLTGMNERMQMLTAKLGNGINIKNTIDGAGFITRAEHTGSVSTPWVATYDFNWKRGTLNSRYNQYYNWNEQFSYDAFDRLVSWSDPNGVNSNQYAADGRITNSSQVGVYTYNSSTRYKKSSIGLNTPGKAYYEKKPAQHITYNVFKNPVEITEGEQKIKFGYNIHNTRTRAEVSSGSLNSVVKYYSDDKQIELISDKDGVKIITYISDSPYEAPVMHITRFSGSGSKVEEAFYYLHRDYQGTILAVSNEQGQTVERRLFDPWGKVVKVTDKNGSTQTVNPQFVFIDRGYTGHEHFFSVGLIHMNGRMYDPVLKQFLSPDNFIQEPFNSQNYNRYGYVLNNPLMYTDYSGESFTLAGAAIAAGIGALIGGATYTAYALYTDTFSWSGFAKNVVLGGVAGAVSYGVGSLTEIMKTGICAATETLMAAQVNIISAGIGVGLHAISQGIIVGISGGDVLSGMSSGDISSLVASAVGLGGAAVGINGTKTFGTLFFGTVSGGFGSALTGGNFWQGAATGLIVSGLNHVMHAESPDNGYEKDENGEYRQINDDGGDLFDFLYGENGQILEFAEVQIYRGQTVPGSGIGSSMRDYGKRFVQDSPALYDPSWDIFRTYVEFKSGFFLSRIGTTFLSKSAQGLAVGLGGSSRTLKSSYLFKYKWGFNVTMGVQLPTLYGRTGNLGVFLGRNSLLMGGGLISDGMFRWSDKIYNSLFY